MAKAKRSDGIIRMKCTVCKHMTYYTHKNKKQVERKIELKKYCAWCRKSTPHKEARLTGK